MAHEVKLTEAELVRLSDRRENAITHATPWVCMAAPCEFLERTEVTVRMPGLPSVAPGDAVCIEAPHAALHLFDAGSGTWLNERRAASGHRVSFSHLTSPASIPRSSDHGTMDA